MMRNTSGLLRCGALLACGALACGAAGAQAGQDDPANTSAERKAAQKDPVITGKETSADKQFLAMAIQGNLAEIQMAQMALKKSSNGTVTSYAQLMIDDHTASNNQAMQIAKKKGMTVPTAPDAASLAMMKRLSAKKSGFNRMYITDQVADHKKDIAMFQKEAKTGYDDDIKAYAVAGLPMLQTHLTTAKTLMNPTRGSIAPTKARPNSTSRSTGSSGAGAAPGTGGRQ